MRVYKQYKYSDILSIARKFTYQRTYIYICIICMQISSLNVCFILVSFVCDLLICVAVQPNVNVKNKKRNQINLCYFRRKFCSSNHKINQIKAITNSSIN